MGHMKQILMSSLVLVIGLIFVTSVSAHEGSVDLTSSKVSCKGVSLYQDGMYHVTGRCDGLTYPYETLYNKYVLWCKTDKGDVVRIAEVDRGYFSGNIENAFNEMYITAEKDSLIRKPSDKQVVSGSVSVFSFDKSQVTTVITPATNTASNKTTTVQTGTTTVKATAGAVVGKIVTSLLVIILVVVGLVIGASLIFRSRNSVSA